ncbi:MAG: endolytic transglycosylase MltG [Bacilli bacterium]
MKRKPKKIVIVIGAILLLVMIFIVGIMISLTSVSKTSKEVTFIVSSGTSKKEIVNNLKTAGLIKSKYSTFLYILLSGNKRIEAGTYILNKEMSTPDVIKSIEKSKNTNTVTLTFPEGTSIKKYLKQMEKTFNFNESDMTSKLKDKTFLNSLISEFWFLDESILNDKLYYSLEGYLFPDTYQFFKNSSFEDIIRKMLKGTEKKLSEYKDANIKVHDILTKASIIEKEAVDINDRYKVSQVIDKRINIKMPLGMDVTAYYGAKKDLTEEITKVDLNALNAYNTRNLSYLGLPVGPICNPGIESIKAAINPATTNYTYFIADLKTGLVYFMESYDEFISIKNKLGN